MAIKDSGKVTITLDRTTVAMLREKKEGLETWDELMRRLGERRRSGIECVICGAFLEMEDKDKSPNTLAKENGWQSIYSARVIVNREEMETKVELGYLCQSCWKRHGEEMNEVEEGDRKK